MAGVDASAYLRMGIVDVSARGAPSSAAMRTTLKQPARLRAGVRVVAAVPRVRIDVARLLDIDAGTSRPVDGGAPTTSSHRRVPGEAGRALAGRGRPRGAAIADATGHGIGTALS
jgi:hypothetical protein